MKTVIWAKDITAIENGDYDLRQSTLVSVEPQNRLNLTIIVHDDASIETNETFVIFINGSDVGDGIQSVEVTITDDDCKYLTCCVADIY